MSSGKHPTGSVYDRLPNSDPCSYSMLYDAGHCCRFGYLSSVQ